MHEKAKDDASCEPATCRKPSPSRAHTKWAMFADCPTAVTVNKSFRQCRRRQTMIGLCLGGWLEGGVSIEAYLAASVLCPVPHRWRTAGNTVSPVLVRTRVQNRRDKACDGAMTWVAPTRGNDRRSMSTETTSGWRQTRVLVPPPSPPGDGAGRRTTCLSRPEYSCPRTRYCPLDSWPYCLCQSLPCTVGNDVASNGPSCPRAGKRLPRYSSILVAGPRQGSSGGALCETPILGNSREHRRPPSLPGGASCSGHACVPASARPPRPAPRPNLRPDGTLNWGLCSKCRLGPPSFGVRHQLRWMALCGLCTPLATTVHSTPYGAQSE